MKTAAIYARVSSDKQREENTIASQTAALVAFAREQQFEVPQEWVFEDDGYSGASLIRPGLERVRDLAAEGLIQAVRTRADLRRQVPTPGRCGCEVGRVQEDHFVESSLLRRSPRLGNDAGGGCTQDLGRGSGLCGDAR